MSWYSGAGNELTGEVSGSAASADLEFLKAKSILAGLEKSIGPDGMALLGSAYSGLDTGRLTAAVALVNSVLSTTGAIGGEIANLTSADSLQSALSSAGALAAGTACVSVGAGALAGACGVIGSTIGSTLGSLISSVFTGKPSDELKRFRADQGRLRYIRKVETYINGLLGTWGQSGNFERKYWPVFVRAGNLAAEGKNGVMESYGNRPLFYDKWPYYIQGASVVAADAQRSTYGNVEYYFTKPSVDRWISAYFRGVTAGHAAAIAVRANEKFASRMARSVAAGSYNSLRKSVGLPVDTSLADKSTRVALQPGEVTKLKKLAQGVALVKLPDLAIRAGALDTGASVPADSYLAGTFAPVHMDIIPTGGSDRAAAVKKDVDSLGSLVFYFATHGWDTAPIRVADSVAIVAAPMALVEQTVAPYVESIGYGRNQALASTPLWGLPTEGIASSGSGKSGVGALLVGALAIAGVSWVGWRYLGKKR